MKAKLALTLLIVPAWAGCGPSPSSPSRPTAADVLKIDRARSQAMVDADADRLATLLDDELTYSHSNGRVDDKTSLTEKLVSGRMDYLAIDSTDPRVRLHGETAIVTGPVSMRVGVGERVLDLAGVYTAVYCHEDASWRLVAYHSSSVRP